MAQKSKAWYIKYPLDAYAMGPIRFKDPVGITMVREWTKNWEKCDKLPRGWSAWPTND